MVKMSGCLNILVVEDDDDINQLLTRIIRNDGYSVQPAYSGTEAILYTEQQSWDLILLDLMLPGMSGEEVLKKVSENTGTPVIIISAKGETQTKIESLKSGADDFITKPFDIEEVSARIESVLRRYRRSDSKIKQLAHKDITVDLNSKSVEVTGELLMLTAREYKILVTLMSEPKKVFSKANIFESVWDEAFHDDDNTVNVHMSNLRAKLGEANPDETYIETVWGLGYKMKS